MKRLESLLFPLAPFNADVREMLDGRLSPEKAARAGNDIKTVHAGWQELLTPIGVLVDPAVALSPEDLRRIWRDRHALFEAHPVLAELELREDLMRAPVAAGQILIEKLLRSADIPAFEGKGMPDDFTELLAQWKVSALMKGAQNICTQFRPKQSGVVLPVPVTDWTEKLAVPVTKAPVRPVVKAEPPAVKSTARKVCLKCVQKHIAKALVLLGESKLGYPDHRWLAIGNLSEAEDECVDRYPQLAISIRADRLTLMDSDGTPDLMRYFEMIRNLEAAEIHG